MKAMLLAKEPITAGREMNPALIEGLDALFNGDLLVLCPYEGGVLRLDWFPKVKFEVVPTDWDRNTPGGRIEHVLWAAHRINLFQPEVLAFQTLHWQPVLDKLTYTPRKVVAVFDDAISLADPVDALLFDRFRNRIDLVVYSARSAVLNTERGALQGKPFALLPKARLVQDVPPPNSRSERNGRILAELPARSFGFIEHLLRSKSPLLPLDIAVDDLDGYILDLARQAGPNIRTLKRVSEEAMPQLRQQYSWGLYSYRGDRADQAAGAGPYLDRYVSGGLPLVSGPHLEAMTLIRQYGNGLIAEGGGYGEIVKALEDAAVLARSPLYAKYLQGAVKAASAEFSSNSAAAQFLRSIEISGAL
jgi:hypothetical protein